MPAALTILAPERYPWRFNGPIGSKHNIHIRSFAPFNKVSSRYEGVTVFHPFPIQHFDLVHAFNRIPIGNTPYLIGFESHLPRAFWYEDSAYYRSLRRSLASDRCRGIIAISEHAENIFLSTHEGTPEFERLRRKLLRRLPNIRIPDGEDFLADDDLSEIRIAFIGSHFARKGGCVAVRLAEMARQAGLPLTIDVVSDLKCGGKIWTDPTNPNFFSPYLEALNRPNVRLHKSLPNSDVLALLRRSHFSLLTTFGDTFGYSALESMMNYTPVIGTRQGALPEFIENGVNGILLALATNSKGEWIHSSSIYRDTESFERIFRDEVERLAREALSWIVRIMSDSQLYRRLRCHARRTTQKLFNHLDARQFWDELYRTSVRASCTD